MHVCAPQDNLRFQCSMKPSAHIQYYPRCKAVTHPTQKTLLPSNVTMPNTRTHTHTLPSSSLSVNSSTGSSGKHDTSNTNIFIITDSRDTKSKYSRSSYLVQSRGRSYQRIVWGSWATRGPWNARRRTCSLENPGTSCLESWELQIPWGALGVWSACRDRLSYSLSSYTLCASISWSPPVVYSQYCRWRVTDVIKLEDIFINKKFIKFIHVPLKLCVLLLQHINLLLF